MIVEALRRAVGRQLGSKLLATTFWSALGEASSKGLMLLSFIITARLLGSGGYGEFGLIRTTIGFFALFGGVGLGLTANKYVAKFRVEKPVSAGQIIGSSYTLATAFGSIVAGILLVSSPYIADSVLGAPQLNVALSLASALLLTGALNGAQIGILQGLEAYRPLAISQLLQGVLLCVGMIVGARANSLNGVMVGYALSAVLSTMIFHMVIRAAARERGLRIVYTRLDEIMPIFLKFSIPVALMGVAVAPFKWAAETMLAKESGFEQLGVFHAAFNVATVFIVACSTLNAPLITISAGHRGRQDGRALQYLNLYGSWYLFLALATPLLLFPAAPVLLFGDGYGKPELAVATLLLLTYAGLMLYFQGIMRLLTLHGSLWFALLTNLFEGISLFLVFYALAEHGVFGLAIAYTCSYVVRILVAVPTLLHGGVIDRDLLCDRYFLGSCVIFGLVVTVQLARAL